MVKTTFLFATIRRSYEEKDFLKMNNNKVKNWPLVRRKNALEMRAKIIQAIRKFFIDRGYLEVETPHLIPTPAPDSFIDPVSCGDWFLHPSPEIYMKRMLAAGYERIFQICRCWREGERGRLHSPEFTLLEWYREGEDYQSLMDECEEMIQTLSNLVGLDGRIHFENREIDISRPWERISVEVAFNRYTRFSMKEAIKKGLFDELMVSEIEPRLGIKKPTFLYDYPAERGAMARLKREDPSLAERFELYIGGVELANAFFELTDAEEQRSRFYQENANRRSLNKPIYPLPEKFLEEMETMPSSLGVALGVDRLVMVLLNASSIDEVMAFTPEEL